MTSIDNNNYTGNNINNGVKFHEDLDNVPEPVARYYSMSYENLINGGSSISEYVIKGERITVTQEDFEDWKEFVGCAMVLNMNYLEKYLLQNLFFQKILLT